jgi:hypothetical protein
MIRSLGLDLLAARRIRGPTPHPPE